MGDWLKIKARVQLRKNAKNKLVKELVSLFGDGISGLADSSFEKINTDEYTLILVGGKPLIFEVDGQLFPTVRGALELELTQRLVVVDKGAVRFVSKGADIMSPGIVKADPEIKAGELVVIVEETHGKALAIGRALMDGLRMKEADSGKAVKSITYVGDKLWNLDV